MLHYLRISAQTAEETVGISGTLAGLGGFGVFLVSLLDSALIPIPSGPDIVLMTMSYQMPSLMPVYVAAATIGSVLGSFVLYYIGRAGGAAALSKVSAATQERVLSLLNRYDIWSLLLACILPPPFPLKVFVLTAGVLQMWPLRFGLAMILGRAFRFSLEGFLAVRYGEQAFAVFRQYYPVIGLTLALLIVVALVLKRFYRPAGS